MVSNSAQGTASHTPMPLIIFGQTYKPKTIKTKVRKIAKIADMRPLPKAVNMAAAKIFTPAKIYPTAKIVNPCLAKI